MWRPLFGPLQDYPLAVCDSRTVHANDLIKSDYVYPNFESESFVVKHSPVHRWYYLGDQNRDEILLITNYDSKLGLRTASSWHG